MRCRRCWAARWAVDRDQLHRHAGRGARDARGRPAGSILSLLCDSGERYLPSYHDAAWVKNAFGDIGPAQQRVDALVAA
jgi:hypothetical protein